jgi:hypothetical protein
MMEDRMPQPQVEQPGDIIDALDDPAVMNAFIRLEADCGGDIGAGFPAYSRNPKPVTPEQRLAMRRTVRLHSIVLSDLAELIQSVNLGAGTHAAITEGRRRIRHHLAQLTDEQRRYFDALVDEDLQQLADKPLRAQLKSVVHSLLSEADWSAIGQAATDAIQHQWTAFMQRSKTA